MKVPEFIPFHFDKFNSNLFRKFGAVGVGRWCMIRKAVAEQPTLTINLNDLFDRESLELDSGCSENDLDELLNYAAQRGMIDAALYATGILWIENLDTDLGRFFTAGKRHLPKRPELIGKIPVSNPDLSEKFHEVERLNGIPTHERNETNVTKRDDTYGLVRENSFDGEKWAIEFQEIYSLKAGKPRPMKTAFAQCLIRMMGNSEFETHRAAFEKLKHRAAEFMAYHIRAGTETRFIPNPENWLEDDSWKIDWHKKALEYKNEVKVGGKDNGHGTEKPESLATKAAKFTRSHDI